MLLDYLEPYCPLWVRMHEEQHVTGSRLGSLFGFYGRETALHEAQGRREVSENARAAMQHGQNLENDIISRFLAYLDAQGVEYEHRKPECRISFTQKTDLKLVSTSDSSIIFKKTIAMTPFIANHEYVLEVKAPFNRPDQLQIKPQYFAQLCLECLSYKSTKGIFLTGNEKRILISHVEFPNYFISKFFFCLAQIDLYKRGIIDFSKYYTSVLPFRRLCFAVAPKIVSYQSIISDS